MIEPPPFFSIFFLKPVVEHIKNIRRCCDHQNVERKLTVFRPLVHDVSSIPYQMVAPPPDACTGISPVETSLKVFYKNRARSDKFKKMQSLNFHGEIILNVNVYLFCVCVVCLCDRQRQKSQVTLGN